MAKQIAGPNLNMIKSGIGQNLSTDNLINNKLGIQYYTTSSGDYVIPVYYTPYTGTGSYADSAREEVSPFSALNNVAYATSMLSQSGADLGVDYGNYSNFVHFGSAQERLEHFRDKLESIQFHRDTAETIKTSLNAQEEYQIEAINKHIDLTSTILAEFDGYDRYLYFATSSATWPKDANGVPLETESLEGLQWFNSQLTVAQDYDLQNQNRLINTLPDYIREDNNNNPALVFCDMIGQHYDNLLLYADGISQKHNADNRLEIGVSRDLIADTLKGFGIKLYESQLSTADLSRLYVGQLLPTGSEHISTTISGSNQIPSVKDQLDGTNKRLFHSLPHILQTKGTKRGLRALVNTFGIPSNNLLIKEFGGINKDSGQNFGAAEYIADSLGKVRLDNTGSYVSGDTLSSQTLTYQPDTKYTQDLHVIEVGWSTNQQKDNYITGSLSSIFEIDNYIGDPRDRHEHTYSRLKTVAKTYIPDSQSNTLYDFLRLLRYFDNQIFSMIKDFVPARVSIRKGAIIKPHILEKSKMGIGFASQSLHQISSSIDVYEVSGGFSETWNDHDTTYTELRPTALGYVTQSIDDQRAKYDGELGGSVIEASNGEMNPNNPLKDISTTLYHYDTTKFTNQNDFNSAIVSPGNMYLYYYDPFAPPPLDGGGGPIGGGVVYSQSLDVVFQYNTNFDVDIWQVAVQRNGSYVTSVSNPDDADPIYSTTTLLDGDTITMHIQAEDTTGIPDQITVEILQGGSVVATHTALEIAFTQYTYTVPTLSSQGTSVTFNYRIT